MNFLLPLVVVLTSLVPGLVIFFLPSHREVLRRRLNMAGAWAKVALVGYMLWGVAGYEVYETRIHLAVRLDLVLRADALSMLFVTLSAVLWLLTTLYAIGYLRDSPHRNRFFGFFSLCVSATTGIALAGNLFTFFIFYELLTLTTYPLVVHRGTAEAQRAGWVYLAYTLAGGSLLLLAVVWLHVMVGPFDFRGRGVLSGLPAEAYPTLRVVFAGFIIALGVKAALVPLHGWLPRAMVAPAPVSALLHAVAVVKAGAFGIVRLVYDVFGIEFCERLGVLRPLAVAAAVTIVYGSCRALVQDDLKRLLAFSTVSQVSYIVLGVATLGPLATIGGVVHLVHQGIMKITLFFCAGNVAEAAGVHRISDMGGLGRVMPWTMSAFTVAAFGMIGVPPMAGFISKWYLAQGALAAGQPWVLAVLIASTLLNAAYFLPILYRVWFLEIDPSRRARIGGGRVEPGWLLLLPPLTTALLAVAMGLLAGTFISPLTWVRIIAGREYGL